MQFSRLTLHGFKSFQNRTEIPITPGITGIAGPNGCGKSNIVEALRWVMGESSARRMRGEEMDDVIFAGASHRPARNIAEVTLTLSKDPDSVSVLSGYDDAEEIIVSRRITRGANSLYQINGRDVRARDVQLLFADLATGAGSSAIVSQGRVNALIAARPGERRQLLEEAAGIRGLQTRRHDAELRLKGTMTNLERLADVLAERQLRLDDLERQAKTARRYRAIGEQIRTQEAILWQRRWGMTAEQEKQAKAAAQAGQAICREKEQAAIEAAQAQATIAARLPALRDNANTAAAKRTRLNGESQRLAEEYARVEQNLANLAERLTQTRAEQVREKALADDAARELDQAKTLFDRSQADQSSLPDQLEAATQNVKKCESSLGEAEQTLARLNDTYARTRAQHDQLGSDRLRIEKRLADIAAQKTQTEFSIEEETRTTLEADLENSRQVFEAEESRYLPLSKAAEEIAGQLTQAGEKLDDLRKQSSGAVTAHAQKKQEIDQQIARHKQALESAAIEQLRKQEASHHADADRLIAESQAQSDKLIVEAQATLTRLEGEHIRLNQESERLMAALSAADDGQDSLMNRLTIPAGLETALGAALGESLFAGLTPEATRFWKEIQASSSAPAWSAGVNGLQTMIPDAPPVLARRLSYIGLIDDAAPDDAQDQLAPGQCLVDRKGGVWRWDGYIQKPGAPNQATTRLQDVTRLRSLTDQMPELEQKISDASQHLEEVKSEAQARQHEKREAILKTRDQTIAALRKEAEADIAEKIAAYQDTELAELSSLEQQAEEAVKTLEEAQQTHQNLLEQERTLRTQRDQAFAEQLAARKAVDAAADQLSRFQQAIAERQAKAERLADEETRLTAQLEEIRETLENLPTAEAQKAKRDAAQEPVEQTRQHLFEARAGLNHLQDQQARLNEATEQAGAEVEKWTARLEAATDRLDRLNQSEQALMADQAEQADAPDRLSAERSKIQAVLEEAEQEAATALEEARAAETSAMEADNHQRQADRALSEAQTESLRLQAEQTRISDQLAMISDQIEERFQCSPTQLQEITQSQNWQDLPELEAIESKLQRLGRERENMGAVNLLAEEEADELRQDIAGLETESADLEAAVNKLRQAISQLNREGRARLQEAFTQVDQHFKTLFQRLFGGGEAELRLLDAEDPLESGLDIFARPPGKKMQSLSLLSGGEQALTALSLLFAMFQTNPAPICILDEVDAPLDDANVDRFLTLLEEIAHNGTDNETNGRGTDNETSGRAATRFLIVTHHRMTLARADRLYGVTMAERGVSQMVAVDLGKAVTLAE